MVDTPARSDVMNLVLDFMQMEEFAKDPFVIQEASGIRLRSTDGREYIDGLAGVFTVSLGHGNQRIIDAVTEQLKSIAFAPPLHGTNPQAIELAKELIEFAPPGVSAVKFVSGGSEATEAAMKLARQYHVNRGNARKYKIVAKYGAYHGATMGALSAGGGWERKSVFEPLLGHMLHVHPPYCFRCPYGYPGPENCGTVCADIVERTILAEDPETVAAIIMEPISISSAGFVVPPPSFFKMLREYCDRYDILLIFDEIITGFGRLGTNFGADYYGVVPDLIACGKGMSSGYAPLAAVLIQEKVNREFLGKLEDRVEFHHGHTFGGNPVACAAGLAAIRQIKEENLVEHARQMGLRMRERLEAMRATYPMIGEVRGAGLLQGVEIVADRDTRRPYTPDVKPGKMIERAARERGLIFRTATDYVAFSPPLVSTPADIDEMCDILDQSLAEVAELLPRQ
ncbi:MAG: aspartate aminotransferase family protein [Chloroflexi bacterium]|nr:aspartate aminotransferase family protein [Chloroflexota bacterium]